jgi:hypothetical protein
MARVGGREGGRSLLDAHRALGNVGWTNDCLSIGFLMAVCISKIHRRDGASWLGAGATAAAGRESATCPGSLHVQGGRTVLRSPAGRLIGPGWTRRRCRRHGQATAPACTARGGTRTHRATAGRDGMCRPVASAARAPTYACTTYPTGRALRRSLVTSGAAASTRPPPALDRRIGSRRTS